MAQVMVNFRMDEDLKKRMEHACAEMGLSMTTAFTIFARKVANEQRIPFEVSVDHFYSQSNMEYLKKLSPIWKRAGPSLLKEICWRIKMRLLWEEKAWQEYCQ